MKRIYNYTLLAVIAFATVSCNNEELTPENLSAVSGDEVQFGLLLGNPATKTIYGDEAGNAFPIYWVNEDKVQIFSPQCLEGRRSAEYKVTVSGTKQDYADALTRTGGAGVQWSSWGDNEGELYSFYSLYPSGNYTLSDDGTKAENIVINYNQNIAVNDSGIKSDMEDCLMYAKTVGVERGNIVNLTYDPISTVIYVTLKVATGTGVTTNEYTIQSISLTAYQADDKEVAQNIAGTFSMEIANGSFAGFVDGKASSTVLAQITNPSTGGFHTISNGESLSVPLFIAPITGLNVKNWKIQVVANNTTYTKTLNIDKVLVPGEIHKITLPELSATSTVWQEENWMQNIPRNVYLSEVSLPGSWNSLNPEFQGTSPTINAQYTAGVRAFHLDTRWASTASPGKNWLESIGGSLIDDYYQKSNLNSGNMYLSVADGTGGHHVRASGSAASDSYGQVTKQNNTSFSDYLSQITGKVSDSEYMVLICSFAQESFEDASVTGKTWLQAVSDVCKDNSKVYDARNITKNTLVGDVLGHVIVIVNTLAPISNAISLPAESKCLFMYLPSSLTTDHFPATGYNQDELWRSKTTIESSGITVYNSQTQITATSSSTEGYDTDRGYAPSITERTTVLNNILAWSQENYNKTSYSHDMWIYLGLGGYQMNSYNNQVSNSHSVIAKEYNNWINNKIEQMGTEVNGKVVPYYPVGIVLINFTTDNTTNISTVTNSTLTSADVVKKILLLNNQYRLQYNPDYPTDYNPNIKVKSAAQSYSSGMNTSDAAFGWD